MMEQVGSDYEELLGAWRRGCVDRAALFAAVRGAMRHKARRGIRSITSDEPDPHVVEDVVYEAFVELERHDPSIVTSVVGLAAVIAYRRAQDAGRKIIREREGMRDMLATFPVVADPQYHEDDVRAAAEDEIHTRYALECMRNLTAEQRDVVRATIIGNETLSDWALRAGKTHQVASRQRQRAIAALRRCVKSKESRDHEGGNHDQ